MSLRHGSMLIANAQREMDADPGKVSNEPGVVKHVGQAQAVGGRMRKNSPDIETAPG